MWGQRVCRVSSLDDEVSVSHGSLISSCRPICFWVARTTPYCGTQTQRYSASALEHETQTLRREATCDIKLQVLWHGYRCHICGLDSKAGKILRNAPP
jgi:hypothetical protein